MNTSLFFSFIDIIYGTIEHTMRGTKEDCSFTSKYQDKMYTDLIDITDEPSLCVGKEPRCNSCSKVKIEKGLIALRCVHPKKYDAKMPGLKILRAEWKKRKAHFNTTMQKFIKRYESYLEIIKKHNYEKTTAKETKEIQASPVFNLINILTELISANKFFGINKTPKNNDKTSYKVSDLKKSINNLLDNWTERVKTYNDIQTVYDHSIKELYCKEYWDTTFKFMRFVNKLQDDFNSDCKKKIFVNHNHNKEKFFQDKSKRIQDRMTYKKKLSLINDLKSNLQKMDSRMQVYNFNGVDVPLCDIEFTSFLKEKRIASKYLKAKVCKRNDFLEKKRHELITDFDFICEQASRFMLFENWTEMCEFKFKICKKYFNYLCDTHLFKSEKIIPHFYLMPKKDLASIKRCNVLFNENKTSFHDFLNEIDEIELMVLKHKEEILREVNTDGHISDDKTSKINNYAVYKKKTASEQ